MRHFNIPVFVPELACPNRCIFCNQNSISGCAHQPTVNEADEIIRTRLATIPCEGSHIEIAFFGGNFTGIEPSLQREFLSVANRYLKEGAVHGIRLSTRPDYIDADVLKMLKEYGVTTIELGAQSLDDEVLRLAGRGHTAADIEKASGLIRKAGIELGLQMMTGLPGDTPEKSVYTAKRIIQLGASQTRIYPTLVIRGTSLAKLWEKGLFTPQSLDEAVSITAALLKIFREGNVKVLRVGLHPSTELLEGGELLAGPFHPNLRQLAEKHSAVSNQQSAVSSQHSVVSSQQSAVSSQHSAVSTQQSVFVNGEQEPRTKNQEQRTLNSELRTQNSEQTAQLIVADKRIPLPAKNALRNMGRTFFLEDQLTTYKSIAGHPDIFMCGNGDQVVLAPGGGKDLDSLKQALTDAGYTVTTGTTTPGREYPASASYNAVVTAKYIIHNTRITDPAITKVFVGRELIHVNQGYTRCNLLPLNEEAFITSDRGIERALLLRSLEVLFVDPAPIILKGQKHGFFPGCCGIYNHKLIVNGNLSRHPEGSQIKAFAERHRLQLVSLYEGELRDVGSLFFFAPLSINV